MLRSLLVSAVIGMATMLLPVHALAQASFVCPTGPGPGERQVGWAGGGQGVAQVAICVADGNNAGGGSQAAHPGDGMAAAVNAMLRAIAANHAQMQGMRNDPRYRKYMEGEWKFISEPYQGEKMCGVAFLRQGQIVLLHGPGVAGQSGAMSFMDFRDPPLIPRPKDNPGVRVALTQNNEAPQTLVASNNTGAEGSGVLMLQVPTMQAMMDSIDDTMSFKLEIDGKVVIETAWQDGHKAKEFLRTCMDL